MHMFKSARAARPCRNRHEAPRAYNQSMLQLGEHIRFTPAEIDEAHRLGIDLTGVRTQADYSIAVIRLIEVLEKERPDLLERIARMACEATGQRMPPRLAVVPSSR